MYNTSSSYWFSYYIQRSLRILSNNLKNIQFPREIFKQNYEQIKIKENKYHHC